MTFFTGFREGFTAFGHRVNSVVTVIVLVPVYFVGIGLTAVLGRVTRKKFLVLKPEGSSYWLKVEEKEDNIDNCRRSF
jgi:hypothetical protein